MNLTEEQLLAELSANYEVTTAKRFRRTEAHNISLPQNMEELRVLAEAGGAHITIKGRNDPQLTLQEIFDAIKIEAAGNGPDMSESFQGVRERYLIDSLHIRLGPVNNKNTYFDLEKAKSYLWPEHEKEMLSYIQESKAISEDFLELEPGTAPFNPHGKEGLVLLPWGRENAIGFSFGSFLQDFIINAKCLTLKHQGIDAHLYGPINALKAQDVPAELFKNTKVIFIPTTNVEETFKLFALTFYPTWEKVEDEIYLNPQTVDEKYKKMLPQCINQAIKTAEALNL